MTPRLRILSAASATLFAIAFASVAQGQQGCFMDCNRAPDKSVDVSSDPVSSKHMGAIKNPVMRSHTKKASPERGRHVDQP